MEALFLKTLNISITAIWLALAVFALRLVLKKAPKAVSVIMWALVGVRLACPFSIESVVSLIPSAETVPPEIAYADSPAINSGIAFVNSSLNPIISESFSPTVGDSVNPLQIVLYIASIVWLTGMAAMLLYAFISYILIRRKVREAALLKDNIYLCDRIETPFILGVLKPRIYLPSTVSEADARYVISHENAHMKRLDHVWKPLGFLLLSVHWFNPVLWPAYIYLCRDIELACDERVIKELGIEIKKPYSEALINCSVPRRSISACPLAFGEVGVKSRIKGVLNYKKPAFWLVVLAVLVCVALAVLFLTNPKGEPKDESADSVDESSLDSDESSSSEVSEESTDVFSEFIEYPVTDDIEDLKQRYPQYFELDCTKGLTVYVWQFAPSHYSCGLMQGSPDAHEQSNVWALRSCTLPNMRKIVDFYRETSGSNGVNVQIFPIYNPIYSYYYEINSTYTHNLLNKFWFSWYDQYFGVFKDAVFDVDGDGEDEMCTLTYNPFTGMQYDYLVIYKNGQIKGFATYGNSGCELDFHKKADGTYCVKAEKFMKDETYYLDICFTEEGAIELKSEDLTLTPFSGQK